jgi:hypothetical protein
MSCAVFHTVRFLSAEGIALPEVSSSSSIGKREGNVKPDRKKTRFTLAISIIIPLRMP